MSVRTSFQVALKSLAKNKLQTGLTMLGMMIGVATVLTMFALGSGAQTAIEDQVRSAGMNLITVTAGNYKAKTEDDFGVVEFGSLRPIPRPAPRPAVQPTSPFKAAIWNPDGGTQFTLVFHPEDDPLVKHDHPTSAQRLGDLEAGLGSAATLTPADADAIRKLPGVQYVSEGVHENVHVEYGDTRWFSRLHGDDVNLPNIRRAWTYVHGRFYNERELDNAEQVLVLGNVVSEKLFGEANPVGELVYIWHQPFKIVGVVSSNNWLTAPKAGDDQFDAVYAPYTTIHRLLNLSKLNDISVTAKSTGDVSRLADEITELIRKRHGISNAQPDDFTVTTQARKALGSGGMLPQVARSVVGNADVLDQVTLEQLGATLERSSRTMTALLASIAAVSLLVGGIGIMNIMLLSVTERTKEIGIRRAVGARSKDVLLQFLLEATAMSLTGGTLGILVGVLAAMSISTWAPWSVAISPIAVAISFSVAVLVGIFFGYYPARQASEVAPIESLRYE